VIITTEPKHYPDADIQEVASRHDSAASAMGKLARALDTIPPLSAEIGRLRVRLARTLTDLHNLVAAGRAALGANSDGEPDPLYYLRDELDAQGQLPLRHRERP
jgi:ABC-type transporter Mla subunit MlaD